MSNYIESLKDPYLVLTIQQYFGIYFKEDNKNLNIKKKEFSAETENTPNNSFRHNYRKNKNFSDENSKDDLSSDSDSEKKNVVIKNRFWYYLFVFGTELGDELFYATFFPFWFWNIDGAVGRRMVMVWTIVMFIGQGLKDIICWPRPSCPPVFRLHKKWSLEYGMPSTHAMVGISIPFSVLFFTMRRYEYPFIAGLVIAVLWCTVVSVSRLYLGMHSVLDVIAGVILAFLLMVPLVPLVDFLDTFILINRWSPIIMLVLSISIIVFHPKTKIWTPTRGDTAVVVSACVGIHLGAWANYQLGLMSEATIPPPYPIIWPSYGMLGLILLRCALGFSCILATRAMCKSAGYAVLCTLSLTTTPISPSSLRNTLELIFKYITYVLIGFNFTYLMPNTFNMLKINRPTFYTEL